MSSSERSLFQDSKFKLTPPCFIRRFTSDLELTSPDSTTSEDSLGTFDFGIQGMSTN